VYRAIRAYIEANDSRCILLTATPYNKTYLDLSNQLRLFVPEDKDLGVRPERLIKALGAVDFARLHQCAPHTLAAFEKSEYADDWRELMRLYMVRRTRSFIQQHYAKDDPKTGRSISCSRTATLLISLPASRRLSSSTSTAVRFPVLRGGRGTS